MSGISVILVEQNITLVFKGVRIIVNKTKNASSFAKVEAKVKEGDVKWLEDNFDAIKSDLELKTNNHFTVKDGKAVLKGTDIPIPEAILKKLVELEAEEEPILPLLKFWKKLSQNPSEESRKDLYGFMIANNIPITEEGDIVTEKGVSQKKGGLPGELLDTHSGSVENNIGNMVQMPRDKVNPDRNQTCSFGLHVGAPDYVRQFYSSSIIIECIVNPKDVVSVPTDYKNTKMRVCSYRVAGYSQKTSREPNKVVKLSDFVNTPQPEDLQKMVVASKESLVKKKDNEEVKVVKNPKKEKTGFKNLDSMSARKIVDYVRETTGEEITISLKSKKSILRKAKELLEIHQIKKS